MLHYSYPRNSAANSNSFNTISYLRWNKTKRNSLLYQEKITPICTNSYSCAAPLSIRQNSSGIYPGWKLSVERGPGNNGLLSTRHVISKLLVYKWNRVLIDCHNRKTLVVKEASRNRGKCDTERANENSEEKHGNWLERGKKLVNKSRLVAVCFWMLRKLHEFSEPITEK